MTGVKQIFKTSDLIIIVMIIQIKLSFLYSIYGIKPDLLLLLLIRLSLKDTIPKRSLAFGFISGFVSDLLTGDVIGITSLSYSVVCFFVSYYRRDINYLLPSKRFVLYLSAISFSSLLIYSVTLSGLGFIFNIVHTVVPAIIYTLTVSAVMQTFRPVK